MDFDLLLQLPESRRDDSWEQDFLKQFAGIKVRLEGEELRQGPDGWPYLFVRTGPDATEPITQVAPWCASHGVGIVVNAHKMLPDYIFPYGMLWNFVETGRFLEPVAAGTSAGEAVYADGGTKHITGAPSEKYLPPYVRAVLREFLGRQGFDGPRVLVISSADFKQVDLVFALESLQPLAHAEHQKLAETLAWFLPLHYTLVLGSEAGLPPFAPL